MNLSPLWVEWLAQDGVKAVHWSTLGAFNATDEFIFQYAQTHQYFILTQDLARIFHTDLLRNPGRLMDAVLDSHFDLGSMYSYSPASKCSPALPRQASRLPRHDQHEISGLDFSQILFSTAKNGPSVILLRIKDEFDLGSRSRIAMTLHTCAKELQLGALLVISDTKVRLRLLPLRPL